MLVTLLSVAQNISAQAKYDNYYHGLAQMEYSNYNEAVEYFTLAQHDGLADAELLLKRIECYLSLGKIDLAIADAKKLEQQNPVQANYQLAKCYALQKNDEKALLYLENHLKSSEKLTKSEIRRTAAFEYLKEQNDWQQLWKQDWYSSLDLDLEEAAYLLKQNKAEDALQLLDGLLLNYDRNHKAYYIRAQANFALEDFHQANDDVQNALAEKPKQANYYMFQAKTLSKISKHEKAIAAAKKALELNPYILSFQLTLGEIYYDAYKSEAAIVHLNKYLSYYSKDSDARLLLANCYFEADKINQAMELVNLLAKDNEMTDQAYLLRGNLYYKKKDYNNAFGSYSMALDLNPGDYKVYVNRAYLYLDMQESEKACRDLKKAYRLGYKPAYELIKTNCN